MTRSGRIGTDYICVHLLHQRVSVCYDLSPKLSLELFYKGQSRVSRPRRDGFTRHPYLLRMEVESPQGRMPQRKEQRG